MITRSIQLDYQQQNRENEMFILVKQDGTTSEPMELFAAIKLKDKNDRIHNAMSSEQVRNIYKGMK